jgi:hypothetical protein
VRLVIERRLERVSDAARRALTTAAVIGRSASFELLLATSGLEEEQLLDSLEEAERATLVEAHERAGDAHYAFVHEQIRQTLLADLSVPRRQRLHARIAAAMQAFLGADAERNAADIAHHLQLAGTAAPRETTIAFLEHAARNALAAVAPEDAIRHVHAALQLLGDHGGAQRAELLAIQARAHRATARIDDALRDLASALALADAGPPHDAILRQRAGLFLDLFDGQAAAADLELVLAAARARGDRHAELDALLALGRAHYVRALDDQEFAAPTRATYEEAHELATELGDRRAMIESLLPTVWFTDYWLDYTPVARANIEEAARLADELGDEQLALEVEAASLRYATGPEAADLAERLRERLEGSHDPVRLKEHYFWLMWHYLGRGEYIRCVETCDLGIDLARQLGSAPVQYGSIKALALTELGRYDLVDAALDEEITDDGHPFGQANQAFARATYLGAIAAWEPAAVVALDAMQRGATLSRVWMQQGMLTLATSLRAHHGSATASATAEIDAIAEANEVRPTALARAELDLAEGRASEARNRLEHVVEQLTAIDSQRDLTRALELLARALSALGEWQDALDACDRGLVLCERNGALPLAWRLRGCRAHTLDALDRKDEAADDRTRAKGEFGTLASRIPDPELRAWFNRQPLAARWLG